MNSLQLTRGSARYKRMRANQRVAKERKRLNPEPLTDELEYIAPVLPKQKFASVSIAIGSDRVSFRVYRYDRKRLVCRGKSQAASTIGRRIAMTLDAML